MGLQLTPQPLACVTIIYIYINIYKSRYEMGHYAVREASYMPVPCLRTLQLVHVVGPVVGGRDKS